MICVPPEVSTEAMFPFAAGTTLGNRTQKEVRRPASAMIAVFTIDAVTAGLLTFSLNEAGPLRTVAVSIVTVPAVELQREVSSVALAQTMYCVVAIN